MQDPKQSPISCYEMLYSLLSCAFCTVLVTSNLIAAKIFTAPLLGIALPVGLITYPLTFLITDVISEVYGAKRANATVYLGFGMSLLTWAIVQVALELPGDPAWVLGGSDGYESLAGYEKAYGSIFSLNGFAVGGSMLAYMAAQLIDIRLFHMLRERTGGRHLWLRNNVSTICSQLVDTALVNLVFLYWGMGLSWKVVLPMTCMSYAYKFAFALLDTPLCYLLVALFRQRLSNSTLEARRAEHC